MGKVNLRRHRRYNISMEIMMANVFLHSIWCNFGLKISFKTEPNAYTNPVPTAYNTPYTHSKL